MSFAEAAVGSAAGGALLASPKSLRILCVSQLPASPPRFGAQARIHGLLTQLAHLCLDRADVSAERVDRAMHVAE